MDSTLPDGHPYAGGIRALFRTALAIFVVTVGIGILNGTDLVDFDHQELMGHVHSGTLGWIIGIHLLEANLLNPKIIGNAAKIHPVVVIFALVVGEYNGGLVGALFAVPVASIVQTLFLFFLRRRHEDHHRPGAAGARHGVSAAP